MSEALLEVAGLVRRETGVVISESQLPALAAALARVAAGMDAERFLGEVALSLGGVALIARLVDEVTVKETYFLRAPGELHALDWPALLKAAAASGADTVNVWVSACATGEEAYTLGILASEALGTAHPPVAILATDVSNAAIAGAAAATYGERAMRNVPVALRERYFNRVDGRFVVAPAPRSLVRFRNHNLLKGPMPPSGELPFDVIACRNVLIYFDADTVERVIGSLEAALRPAGILILGAADRLSGATRRLGRVSLAQPPVDGRREPARPRLLRHPPGREDAGPRPPGNGDAPPLAAIPEHRAKPRRRAEDRIESALRAADAGDLVRALEIVEEVLSAQPLHADAYFVRGLAELGLGDPGGAADSFRRALYVDPSFGLAAFQLGRAHDACGEPGAARRAYERALRTLSPDDQRHRMIIDKVDIGDVAAACRARLRP